MRQRVAALVEQFQRIVETGRIRLAFIGNRPQFLHVVTVGRRRHGRLARRHPVGIAAQRVDFAVMADHPVGMRQRPGREGVRGKPLVNQCQRRDYALVLQVLVVFHDAVGEDEPLVYDGPRRTRHRVIAGGGLRVVGAHVVGRDLAGDIELALERVVVGDIRSARDEDLAMGRFRRLDAFAEHRRIHRHVAPPDDRKPFLLRGRFIGRRNGGPVRFVARHEQLSDAVMVGRRQVEAERFHLGGEKFMRQLYENPGAVARLGVGTDRTAVFEIAEYLEAVFDDLAAALVPDRADHADSAGIVLVRWIIKTLRLPKPVIENGCGAAGPDRARGCLRVRFLVCHGRLLFSITRIGPNFRNLFRRQLRPEKGCVNRTFMEV